MQRRGEQQECGWRSESAQVRLLNTIIFRLQGRSQTFNGKRAKQTGGAQ